MRRKKIGLLSGEYDLLKVIRAKLIGRRDVMSQKVFFQVLYMNSSKI